MTASTLSHTDFRTCFEAILDREVWWATLKEADFQERRPAQLDAYELLMGLVFHCVRAEGTFSSHVKECCGHTISDAALSQRRLALPMKSFELLFDAVFGPKADEQKHPEAFWKGWRLVAIDGTQASVTNTPQILSSMSKANARRFEAAFAKVQLTAAVEVGLHNPLALAIGTQGESERALARTVLERVPEQSLLLADRHYGLGVFLQTLQEVDPGQRPMVTHNLSSIVLAPVPRCPWGRILRVTKGAPAIGAHK